MKGFPFRLEALADAHERNLFDGGEEALDKYFRTQVTQDIRRNIANCFVAVEAETGKVAAYYTLSAASLPVVDLPSEVTKRLPRYPIVPAVRIGRLGVDRSFQRRGLGEAMLADAAARAASADAAAFTLLVEAKSDSAVAFYHRYGFRSIAEQGRSMFLPVATAQEIFLRKKTH
jgi:ribosomal protein S18 acetylase RimI-like enzyme